MENKIGQGILALLAVTALSFGVVIGTKALTDQIETGQSASGTENKTEVVKEIDTSGSEGITSAGELEDGTYLVTSSAKGYGGEVVLDVLFDETAEQVLEVRVREQTETQGVGSKITESPFLQQFSGKPLPIVLSGTEHTASEKDLLEDAVFQDGTYEKSWETADENGFVDHVKVSVQNGKIQEVVWDSVSADGKSKSVMSQEGSYVMREGGLTWAEQAKALGDTVVQDQSLERIQPDQTGKIDTVAGVSISVSNFVSLTRNCLLEAAQIEEPQETEVTEGTQIDAVSGATVSSTAAVNAVNQAWEFLKENR